MRERPVPAKPFPPNLVVIGAYGGLFAVQLTVICLSAISAHLPGFLWIGLISYPVGAALGAWTGSQVCRLQEREDLTIGVLLSLLTGIPVAVFAFAFLAFGPLSAGVPLFVAMTAAVQFVLFAMRRM